MSKALERKMANAKNYDEWTQAAMEYDERNGWQNWKETEASSRYDNAAIRRRLDKLEVLRRANDNHGLLFNLNEGIHGNLGGMGHPALYRRAKYGTKDLIANYVDEIASALKHLSRPRVKGVTHDEKVEFFNRAHLCFGSSALLMSGSGTYLFFHVGVLKALWEQDLIPRVISGSSGGAFLAAIVGSRKPEDLEEVFDPAFFDREEELKEMVKDYSFFTKSKINGKNVKKVVEHLVPDITFEEAYEESGIQINISIAPAEKHQKSRLLNAITSPNVMLREAVLASTCVPGVFPPVTLAAKDVNDDRVPYLPNRKWVDGSLSDDLPMKRLSRLYGVNHFIVSQTNPLVLPFIDAEKNVSGGLAATITATSFNTIKNWGVAASHLLQRPLSDDSYFSKVLNGYISVASQSYTGDINILPSRILNPTTALRARTPKQIEDMILDGERSSWPVIEKIRIQTKISRILDRITEDLKRKSMHKQSRTRTKPKTKAGAKDKLRVVSK